MSSQIHKKGQIMTYGVCVKLYLLQIQMMSIPSHTKIAKTDIYIDTATYETER